MYEFAQFRVPPDKRKKHCCEGKELYFSEGAVMIAFAMHLLETGASEIDLHPDGEHGKCYDLRQCLISRGFPHSGASGKTSYSGQYLRDGRKVTIAVKPGLGDVKARIGDCVVVAECKGGVINSNHAGQISRLRKGLYEAVGLLMSRSLDGERHIAVVPLTAATSKIAEKLTPRARVAGIEVALIDQNGNVSYQG